MNRLTRPIYFALAAGITLGLAQAEPRGVQAATNDAAIVYSHSDSSMIAQADDAAQTVRPSGDPDKDFVRRMMVRNSETMAMVKVEVAHGKDPKAKAMAQKLLDQETANAKELKELLGGGI
jgi:uncharacterized protein (DUF305 family)